MFDPGVPHPGLRPEPLQFPLAAARAAMAAIRAKIEDLASFRAGHGDAAAEARVGFEGRARQGFDRAFEDGMADIDHSRRQLEDDLDDLERLVAEAQRAIEARADEIVGWQQRLDAWNEAMTVTLESLDRARP